MANYNFPQFNTELVNPTVHIDTITVNLTLTSPNGDKFGVTLDDIVIDVVMMSTMDLCTKVSNEISNYQV